MFFFTACGYSDRGDAGRGRTVIDDLGHEVRLPGKIDRIATNYGIAAHMVIALGAGHRLVALDTYSRDNSFYHEVVPAIKELPQAGLPFDADPEIILKSRPDIVLTMGRMGDGGLRLSRYGITAYAVKAETIESLPESMLRLGSVLGCGEKASRFSRYYNDKIKMIRRRLKGIAEKERPLVYLTGPMGLFSTCSGEMMQHHIIELCGGRNAGGALRGMGSGHGWTSVSMELVIAWNPGVILIIKLSPVRVKEVTAQPELAGVDAVKHKRVYEYPSRLYPWDYPSPQTILGMLWLAKKLHPRLFDDINVQREADDFFTVFYGKSFSAMGGSL
jgi:iron complex transport system substrate-binding protein